MMSGAAGKDEGVELETHRLITAALQEEVRALEAELEALRGSARYRLGDIILSEIWPLRWSSFKGIRTLFLLTQKRLGRGNARAFVDQSGTVPEAFGADVLVFGKELPAEGVVGSHWLSQDENAVVAILFSDRPPGTLLIRDAHETLLRCAERARLAGWHVIWSPEEVLSGNAALTAYAEARFGLE